MVKVLHTADIHLGLVTHGRTDGGRNSRLTDLAKTFDRFAETAIESKVDMAIVAGDLFDNRRPGPEELNAAAGPLSRLSKAEIRTIIVPGNHDGAGTVHDPDSHTLTWMAALPVPYVHVLTQPQVKTFETQAGPVDVVSIPFPHKRAHDVGPAASTEGMTDRVELVSRDVEATILHMIGSLQGRQVPSIFVGHVTVMGGMAGPERMMRMGWDVTISPETLVGVDYAALGHLHPQQQVAPNAWYAGSPDCHLFGDVADEKGFLLVEVDAMKTLTVHKVPSYSRPFLVLESSEVDGWPGWAVTDVKDATVLMRLRPETTKVPASVLASLRHDLYEAGAFLVKDETLQPEAQRRARVDIDPEVEMVEAVERWAVSKGIDPARVVPFAQELVASFRGESS